MHDQGLHRVEVVIDQRGDVAVAPELAEQRLGMPDHQVGWLGPGQAGVGGEQRTSLVAFGGALGGPAGQRRGPFHLGRADGVTEHAAAARRRPPSRRASSTVAGDAARPRPRGWPPGPARD